MRRNDRIRPVISPSLAADVLMDVSEYSVSNSSAISPKGWRESSLFLVTYGVSAAKSSSAGEFNKSEVNTNIVM